MTYQEALPRFIADKKCQLTELVADDIWDIAHSLAEGEYDNGKPEDQVRNMCIDFKRLLDHLVEGVVDQTEYHDSELREIEAEKIADALINQDLLDKKLSEVA